MRSGQLSAEAVQQRSFLNQVKNWIDTDWCDLLLGAAIAMSGMLGYLAVFRWLSQLIALPIQ
jgi:hypothetical protein